MEMLFQVRNYLIAYILKSPQFKLTAIIEILIFAFIIYKMLSFIKKYNSWGIIVALVAIIVFLIIANLLNLKAIIFVVQRLSYAFLFFAIIVFQPDIRTAILHLGNRKWLMNILNRSKSTNTNEVTAIAIAKASFNMAREKTGALIVIKRFDDLTRELNSGIRIDGKVSSQLIENIFVKNTPLHDGAVLIDKDIILAATCYLPLADSLSIPKSLGTRHRAAFGISQTTDSVTIVVSEETGTVSVVENGVRTEMKNEKELNQKLIDTVYIKNTEEEHNNSLVDTFKNIIHRDNKDKMEKDSEKD